VLLSTFATTVRGTLKGDIVVAVVQGVLGGLIFWLLGLATPVLWGAKMALLSLLPAFGTSGSAYRGRGLHGVTVTVTPDGHGGLSWAGPAGRPD
jgi:hypothetical protein